MKKKILYCASTASHIMNFHLPYIKYFKEQDWHVDIIVAKENEIPYADNVYELPMVKKITAVENLYTVNVVRKFLEKNNYDLISTHTTLAGAIIRLAIKALGEQYRKFKVVYTSHGYFFSGNKSFRDNMYLGVEKFLSSVTDVLMVMNKIDYDLALKYRLGKKIVFIPGMGVNLSKFKAVSEVEKTRLKVATGFNSNDFLLIYAAEMSKRKNQGELIRAFANVAAREKSIKLLLAGDGDMKGKYQQMVSEYGLYDRVFFLGHVSNMAHLYAMCDMAVSTSRSEGLPFNVMEAMACGLPVVASRIKGHIDLLSHLNSLQNLFLYDLGDEQSLANRILKLYKDKEIRTQARIRNIERVKQYGLEVVKPKIVNIYEELYNRITIDGRT